MKHDCDVLVVGGGTAGVPAAVAAARAGAVTVLAERRDTLGGTGVFGLHRYLCGLYPTPDTAHPDRPDSPGDRLLNAGLISEIITALHRLSPSLHPLRLGKADVLPYAPNALRMAFEELTAAEPRLTVRLGTSVGVARFDGERIVSVSLGDRECRPRTIVDCSGDGVIIRSHAALHDAPPARGCQLAGYVIHLAGIDPGDDLLPIKVPYVLRQAAESGALSSSLRFTAFVPDDAAGEGWCKLSVPAGTDDRTAAAESVRLHATLRDALPAFRASRIVGASPGVLEREGARLKGVHTLTADEVLAGTRFPDAIARTAWPIELWDPDHGPMYRHLEPGMACDIPLRCLHSAVARNLFCAGRCISATHEALGSVRVMGPCMAMGEAAGREAARLTGLTEDRLV